MSDKEEIRNLVEKYADAVCRRDEKDWSSTWHEDAVWDLGSMPPVEGKKAIVELWVQAMSGFPFAGQLIQNGTVDVDGDKATGRWYITEHLQFAEKDDAGNPTGMFNIGVYQDRYVKENGEWLFSERHYGVLYNDGGKGNMSGTVNPYPELIK
ncbi:MAG: nuclear transport factor 2 family protein [Hyphomicrobiales bacterium]|jgi:ketosteroid isomerase-like protein|nr:nuclear transport factor 2 family protein [Alphaproteobacteria bacterium]MDG1152758.1 nuclear transport factor 2 family protein [Hyphomicrobiales bacterium]MDG1524065.1 nuclear transport factor 2 family protein [Hyphomicrobiales bacterium]MDG1664702.1 nuclear transport factor 2 family protein [Hyphomicrobiales bacterium]MDG2413646.1 nuclear transport factor 2 family protein [Hyphomicrobiales bacterium]|tara:strand:- start:43 stop:501 length:459 start_codon:yes stop_codon:yes gene_type:complete